VRRGGERPAGYSLRFHLLPALDAEGAGHRTFGSFVIDIMAKLHAAYVQAN
jgi:hypothetical protein